MWNLKSAFKRTYVTSKQPNDFIILNPRESGILNRKRSRLTPSLTTTKPPGISPSPTTTPQQTTLIDAINTLKPDTPILTNQMFNETQRKLLSGFKKQQLLEYITHHQPTKLNKSMLKTQLISKILNEIWNLEVRELPSNTQTVENVVEFSEHEFVLILKNNGKLLRRYAKTGAKLKLWPTKRQLIVQSTPETFKFVQADLSRYLQNIQQTTLNLNTKINTKDPQMLAIQQLTGTYFQLQNQNLNIISTNQRDSLVAQRMLRQLYEPIKENDYFYDVGGEYFKQIDLNLQTEWFNRLTTWSRWEKPITKTKQNKDEHCFTKLVNPHFTSEINHSTNLKDQLTNVVNQTNFKGAVTTLSFGYLLHETSGLLSPNQTMRKIFSPSIPQVLKLASNLPMHQLDTKHEVLNSISWQDYALDVNKTNTKYIHLKFTPKKSNYKPLEVWAQLPVNGDKVRRLEKMPLVYLIEKERNAFISLPSLPTDLRVTSVLSQEVKPTKLMEEYFLEKCLFTSLHPQFIPPILEVEIDGVNVEYMYHSSAYTTVAEVELCGSVVQLSASEGGVLGGRQTEVSVVGGVDATIQLIEQASRTNN